MLSTMAKPRGDDWLEDEMRGLRHVGVDVDVSALTATEQRELGLVGEEEAAVSAGLRYVSIPIRDRSVPQLPQVLPRLRELARDLAADRDVVIHCRYGIGRASLLAAAVLVLEGVDPDDAWRRLADARGREIPDTAEQRRWIENRFGMG